MFETILEQGASMAPVSYSGEGIQKCQNFDDFLALYCPDVNATDLWDVVSFIVITLYSDHSWNKTKRRLNIRLLLKFLKESEELMLNYNNSRFVALNIPRNGEAPFLETLEVDERQPLY